MMELSGMNVKLNNAFVFAINKHHPYENMSNKITGQQKTESTSSLLETSSFLSYYFGPVPNSKNSL